jgi:hypothetical protein
VSPNVPQQGPHDYAIGRYFRDNDAIAALGGNALPEVRRLLERELEELDGASHAGTADDERAILSLFADGLALITTDGYSTTVRRKYGSTGQAVVKSIRPSDRADDPEAFSIEITGSGLADLIRLDHALEEFHDAALSALALALTG